MRAFGDGFVSVLLPLHLLELGFSAVQVGVIATATMLGSAALTLLVGLIAYKLNLRELLIRCSILTVITGLGFTFVHDFWPLLVVAFIGTLNPSSGDVSVFLPTEQALLPRTVSDSATHRPLRPLRHDRVAGRRLRRARLRLAGVDRTPLALRLRASGRRDVPDLRRLGRGRVLPLSPSLTRAGTAGTGRKSPAEANRRASSTNWRPCSVSIPSPAASRCSR